MTPSKKPLAGRVSVDSSATRNPNGGGMFDFWRYAAAILSAGSNSSVSVNFEFVLTCFHRAFHVLPHFRRSDQDRAQLPVSAGLSQQFREGFDVQHQVAPPQVVSAGIAAGNLVASAGQLLVLPDRFPFRRSGWSALRRFCF